MASILVTGGSGLIGWPTMDRLCADGHRVVCFDLQPNPANLRLVTGDVELVVGDVSDLSRLIAVIKRHTITHIVHLAAMVTEPAAADPGGAFRVNTLGADAIFAAALSCGVSRVVWTSSLSALQAEDDYNGEPVPEDYPCRSSRPYGASKHGAEVIADGYRRNFDLDLIGIRPAQTYGIGRLGSGAGIFNQAICNLAIGKPGIIPRTRSFHQWMYNRDMAALFAKALFMSQPKHHLFNAPVARYTDGELEAALLRLCPGGELSFVDIPGHEPKVPLMDTSRAQRELAFAPRYSLDAGLAEMVEHYRRENAP